MTAFHTGCFNATATVTPTTWATQADGSVARSSGTAVENVPCRVNAMSAQEAAKLGREYGLTLYEGFFPALLSDGSTLSITLDSVVASGGVTYRVLGPSVDQGGAGLLRLVHMEVVQ